jgi:hypothetical protein
MKRNPPSTDAELVERVRELFDAVPPEGEAEANEVLQEAGLDPDAVASRFAKFANETLAHSPLDWRQRAKVEREKALTEFEGYRQRLRRASSDMKAQITSILARQPHLGSLPTVRAQFHKFDHASSKDLESLLAELQFLEGQSEVQATKEDGEKE